MYIYKKKSKGRMRDLPTKYKNLIRIWFKLLYYTIKLIHKLVQLWLFIKTDQSFSNCFFFLIRNEEEYINRRKDTGEIKVTKEREETKGRMRCPSYTNWTKEKTPNNRTLKTKRNPNNLQTFEAQTAIQLSCKTLRGTPLNSLWKFINTPLTPIP